MTFYNTNNETGDRLELSRKQTRRQEEAILSYFADRPCCRLSPSQLADAFTRWPITSIRRAVTNLTAAGYLKKTSFFRMGKYGKKEHCWQLKQFKGGLF